MKGFTERKENDTNASIMTHVKTFIPNILKVVQRVKIQCQL